LGDYLLGLVDLILVLLSLGYVFSGARVLLVTWVGLALLFLVVGLVVVRRRSLRRELDDGRVGVLDTLSWIPPVTASAVGVAAAVDVLVIQQGGAASSAGDNVVGAAAIVVAWALLHLGCAHVHQASQLRHGGGLEFPSEPTPTSVTSPTSRSSSAPRSQPRTSPSPRVGCAGSCWRTAWPAVMRPCRTPAPM
jgi:hypothetical protein